MIPNTNILYAFPHSLDIKGQILITIKHLNCPGLVVQEAIKLLLSALLVFLKVRTMSSLIIHLIQKH